MHRVGQTGDVATRPVKASRPRGRPRNADGQVTTQRLIEAAAAVWAERGFDGCTLARIATHADVHPTAIYNHFDSRDELLYAVAVRALDQLTEAATLLPDGRIDFAAIVAVYLEPSMSEPRQILAEIHVVGQRNEHLAALLAAWHLRWADTMINSLPASDRQPRATVQAMFMLLLGLCHADQLSAVGAARPDVVDRVSDMLRVLVAEPQ